GDAYNRGENNAKGIIAAKNGFHPALWYPVVNQRTNADTHQNVGEYLLEGIQHLFIRINQSFPYCQIRRLDVHTASRKDKAFDVLFHVQFLNDRTANDSNDKPQQHIDDGYSCAKNADEQDKTSQINHWRRDQKGECHP